MSGDAPGQLLKPLAAVGDVIASTSIGRILLFLVGAVLFVPSAALVALLMSGPPSGGGPGTAVFFLPLAASILCLGLAVRGHFRAREKRRREARNRRLKIVFLIGVGLTLFGAALWILLLSPKRKQGAP